MTSLPNRTGFRLLRGPAYSFLVISALLQIADFVVSALPARLGSVNWRFGLTGIAANSVGNLLLLVLLAYAIALVESDRIVFLLVGVVAAFISVILLLGSVSFSLDALQLRPRTDHTAAVRFALVVGMALMKLLVEGVLSAFFAVSAFRTAREIDREKSRAVGKNDARFLVKSV